MINLEFRRQGVGLLLVLDHALDELRGDFPVGHAPHHVRLPYRFIFTKNYACFRVGYFPFLELGGHGRAVLDVAGVDLVRAPLEFRRDGRLEADVAAGLAGHGLPSPSPVADVVVGHGGGAAAAAASAAALRGLLGAYAWARRRRRGLVLGLVAAVWR